MVNLHWISNWFSTDEKLWSQTCNQSWFSIFLYLTVPQVKMSSWKFLSSWSLSISSMCKRGWWRRWVACLLVTDPSTTQQQLPKDQNWKAYIEDPYEAIRAWNNWLVFHQSQSINLHALHKFGMVGPCFQSNHHYLIHLGPSSYY